MRIWNKIEGFDFKEILFDEYNHIARITINRERWRNAFTPLTVAEMSRALKHWREKGSVRVVRVTVAVDRAVADM